MGPERVHADLGKRDCPPARPRLGLLQDEHAVASLKGVTHAEGPAVEIEYAPNGGTPDHIHTFYRDPTNDYAAKFIKP